MAKFNLSTFKMFDRDAKTVVSKYLKDTYGYSTTVSKSNFVPDLVVHAGPDVYIEVEVKTAWGWDIGYPFADVRIPGRKAKYLEHASEFWLLNRYLDRAIIVPVQAVRDAPVESVVNRYSPDGEEFRVVPLSQVKFVELRERINYEDAQYDFINDAS